MYTGRKAGSGYADGVSGATFKSITDNPNGASYAFGIIL
jgi:ABC-type enterobactin transport system permease subunit